MLVDAVIVVLSGEEVVVGVEVISEMVESELDVVGAEVISEMVESELDVVGAEVISEMVESGLGGVGVRSSKMKVVSEDKQKITKWGVLLLLPQLDNILSMQP